MNLILLPTSDLRILFLGDDGCIERLATFSFDSESSSAEIKDISADKSGRSFSVQIHGDKVHYFWGSEKSKLLGDELLQKMKDLLNRRPNLSELTGINQSRLDCFAIQLRAYLPGSSLPSAQAGSTHAEPASVDNTLESLGLNTHSTITYSKSSRQRRHGTNGVKSSSFGQGSLSPRPSTFKEGTPRNLSSLKCVAREKMKRLGDGYLSCINTLTPPSSSTDLPRSENDKFQEAVESLPFPSLEALRTLADSSSFLPPAPVSSLGPPFFSPYYVWCPPVSATPHSSRSFSQLPVSCSESFSLPSLSTLLAPTKSSSLLSSIPPFNVAELPSLDFPNVFPEPVVRSQVASSHQILTFTPLMCDPIVHIPVIDVCSSGQGYLVTAGPGITTPIPPLRHNFISPLIPEAESVVEKSARETLRLLMNSSNQPNSLMDVLPSVIISSDERPNIFAAGSRGLYTGTRDVHAITNGFAAMGLVQLGDPFEGSIARRNGLKEPVNQSENSASSTTSGLSESPADARGDE